MNRHADMIRKYAELWITDPIPWEQMKYREADRLDFPWCRCTQHPTWAQTLDYAFIVDQITVAGITFDRPMLQVPEFGTTYYIPCPDSARGNCSGVG